MYYNDHSPPHFHARYGENEIRVNIENELWGEVFEPLKDPSEFQNFVLDKDLRTIVWPSTGADLAPEFLYEKAAA